MLDPSGRMSRDFLLFHEKDCGADFNPETDILPCPDCVDTSSRNMLLSMVLSLLTL